MACHTTANTFVKAQTNPAQSFVDALNRPIEHFCNGPYGSPLVITKSKQLPMLLGKPGNTFLQKLDPRLQFIPVFDRLSSYGIHKGVAKEHSILRGTLPVLLDLEPDNLTCPSEEIRTRFKLAESFPQDQTALLNDVLRIRPPWYK
jgi:hypothetical protein